ncbi:MAG TPA: hypothetical protein VGQ57_08405, partial [Polyangiaceae bacterium]|nr:hypothetical protein [Polyangiaceae bacterium]
MHCLKPMLLGTGLFFLACGGEGNSPHEKPAPGPTPAPLGEGVCAKQHAGTASGSQVVVCDELYGEAPLVHLPSDGATTYAALVRNDFGGMQFVAADGSSYPYQGSGMNDPEMERHALALYSLELDGSRVTAFHPAIVFAESMLVAPFMGKSFEGTISRKAGEQGFALEASLPVRIDISERTLTKNGDYEAVASIANLNAAVAGADGSCLPGLTSYGDEAPFGAAAKVELRASRSPSMHEFGDD